MDLLLAVAAFTVPVLVLVGLSLLFRKRLSGTCGTLGPDGRCGACGRGPDEMAQARTAQGDRSCP